MRIPKRILILGPESTGKSTLAWDLADHFGEPWVPEFAREYLKKNGNSYTYEDLLIIAQGQVASEDVLAQKAVKFLFVDTDLRVIQVWSDHKFGKTDTWVTMQIAEHWYDLILLTDTDLKWEPDPQREHPEEKMRWHFFKKYLRLAHDSGIPYEILSGDRTARLNKAVTICESL
jgi:NadR type nicotinamide-nucleotide adenylyltransferase